MACTQQVVPEGYMISAFLFKNIEDFPICISLLSHCENDAKRKKKLNDLMYNVMIKAQRYKNVSSKQKLFNSNSLFTLQSVYRPTFLMA